MGVEEAIEEYRRVVEEGIRSAKAAKKKLDQLIELQRIKVKRLKGELTDDEIQRALNLLCWKSYAGCCTATLVKGCFLLHVVYERHYDALCVPLD